ncbi:DC-STAMP domain-containing protein 2-like isoform X2 [Mya arenaria]|uniref:DC-STAMP domain-containing protein 2-like isoform X2 n=1 Tax=Mya arenaria TaxID=6604 RepID=UPI0022E867A9|nr:DC-STAMP domain-containing protein 2-like isoform X2 [Mya arenaria]
MYRAVQNYDGSDTEKCINLKAGDVLSAVHALDDTWYLGYNRSTRKTGVFPAQCVRLEDSIEPGSSSAVENPVYTTISDDSVILGVHDADASVVKPIKDDQVRKDCEKKGNPAISTEYSTVQKVRFANDKHGVDINQESNLEKSFGADSVISWQESFETSFTTSTSEHQSGKVVSKDRDEGIYHVIFDDKLTKLKASTDMLFHTSRDENKRIKAVFGALSGFVIGGLFYVILRYSFNYSPLQAGIIVAISTVLICFGLALSSRCRCIMAVVLPNFFTGKGRALFLSIIFGFLLTGPIANIVHNAKETGSSMGCTVELITDQARVLQRQLAEPVKDMASYIAKQKQELEAFITNTNEAFVIAKTKLDEIDKTIAAAESINIIYEKCVRTIEEQLRKCRDACNIINVICRDLCSNLNAIKDVCKPLKSTENFVSNVATKTREAIDNTMQFITADVELKGDFMGNANSSKSAKKIQANINKDVAEKANVLETFFSILEKVLSVSFLLIFAQSFWYVKNYLAKDGYDNFYITNAFRSHDSTEFDNGRASVLPLKKRELSKYVNTRSIKLNEFERKYCTIGLAEVLLHVVFSTVIILFDYILYYVLKLIKTHGSIEFGFQGQGRVKIAVKGEGPLAQFYQTMIKGLDLKEGFTANLHLSRCLPNPSAPQWSTIVLLLLLYLLALAFVILRGYGMRLRRKISAYYYPEQEKARVIYLHKTIRHRRAGFQKFLRQQVKSSHKESMVKSQLRFSTWLRSKLSCFDRCLPNKSKQQCSCCEQEGGKGGVVLKKCGTESINGECDALFCGECIIALGGICPLCNTDEVEMRD